MQAVQLMLAYCWTCPKCEHLNCEPIPSLKKYEPPEKVECLVCEIEYEALPIKDKPRSK